MSSKPKAPRQQNMAPPPQAHIGGGNYGGMGPNMPQNPMGMGSAQTGIGTGAPAWAQGEFAMPWWGQQAPNTGAAMMQQQDPMAYQRMAQMGQPGMGQSAVMPGGSQDMGSLVRQFNSPPPYSGSDIGMPSFGMMGKSAVMPGSYGTTPRMKPGQPQPAYPNMYPELGRTF